MNEADFNDLANEVYNDFIILGLYRKFPNKSYEEIVSLADEIIEYLK